MEATDLDGSGNIDYTEFVAATMGSNLYLLEPHCQAAFLIFDRNCDGQITAEKLNSVLKIGSTGDDNNKQQTAESLLQQVALNGDNQIGFTEFMLTMRR